MAVNAFRTLAQVLFLAIFVFLLVQENIQAWIMVLGLGWLGSLLLGRIYCGWACPMGTLMRAQTWLYRKVKKSRFRIPKLRENPGSQTVITVLRIFMLVLFLAGMMAVRAMGMEINVILYLVILAVITSFFFLEDLWHRICPHGAVMNVTSRPSRWGMKIDKDQCTGCARCEKVCPAQAVYQLEGSKIRAINNRECLVCLECQRTCREEAISYGKL